MSTEANADKKSEQKKQQPAKFLTGSTMGHVVTMTVTSSVGLVALFAVDALNLLYISMLGQKELAAAIGYAGTVMFFMVSLSIGMAIATGATVAKALGQGNRERARNLAGASVAFCVVVMVLTSAVAFPFLRAASRLLGATGETADIATRFLSIVAPTLPLLAMGMALGGVLRALGDAKRAMYVTLFGGFVSAVLDPLFIFGLDLGIDGAAYATVISRAVLAGYGFYSVIKHHDMLAMPDMPHMKEALQPFATIGVPAILTQLATPVGNAYVTNAFSNYGDDAVAGWAVVGRLMPLAFGVIFALSGAVGPIIGQNFGAGNRERVLDALKDALIFTLIYVVLIWIVLALFRTQIADAFGATGEARTLIEFFCLFVAGTFLFNGALFVANAAFNNLGFALYSTVFNWGRATVGVVPVVWIGGHLYGAVGVLAGWGLGALVFGVVGVLVAFRVTAKMEMGEPTDVAPAAPASASSPFSSGKSAGLH